METMAMIGPMRKIQGLQKGGARLRRPRRKPHSHPEASREERDAARRYSEQSGVFIRNLGGTADADRPSSLILIGGAEVYLFCM